MEPSGTLRQKEIIRYQRGKIPLKKRDRVTTEEPLEIRLITGPIGNSQSRSLIMTMRTPGMDYELAAGLLYTEGLIRQKSEIVKMTYCIGKPRDEPEYNVLQVRLRPDLVVDWGKLERLSIANAACGLCGKVQIEQLQTDIFPDFGPQSPQIDPEILYQLHETMRSQQKVFAKTGSIHAAALFDVAGNCLKLCEDVGRHNALDKLIGSYFLNDHQPFLDKILLLSGRCSYEIIYKALKANIPAIIAIGAPSSLAIELATAYGQTLIGFMKSNSFNLYSGFQRFQT